MNESDYTRVLGDSLKECGAFVVPIIGGIRGIRGLPDRHVCHPLWAGWLEAKLLDAKVTELQRWTMHELNKRRPGTAYVVRYLSNKVVQIEYEGEIVGTVPFWGTALINYLAAHGNMLTQVCQGENK